MATFYPSILDDMKQRFILLFNAREMRILLRRIDLIDCPTGSSKDHFFFGFTHLLMFPASHPINSATSLDILTNEEGRWRKRGKEAVESLPNG